MTTDTPVYGLTYPNALDAPCDFPEQWCAFTADVEEVLVRFELGASRVLPAIPVAKVMVTETIEVPEFEVIPFDTVSIDTAGWTNFDVNNQIITVPRTARYTVCANFIVSTQGVLNSDWSLLVNGGVFSFVTTLDRNNNDIGITAQGTGTINAGTEVSLSALAGTTITTYRIQSASLAVYWHADTERAS